MEKEEKEIRFVARFYREDRLDTTRAWKRLGIGKERNHATLLYRLTAIAAVLCLAGSMYEAAMEMITSI